jgi:hypothetical protein
MRPLAPGSIGLKWMRICGKGTEVEAFVFPEDYRRQGMESGRSFVFAKLTVNCER